LTVPACDGFRAEAESFARLLALGDTQWTGSTEEESIDTMSALEAIARSVRSGNWEDVS